MELTTPNPLTAIPHGHRYYGHSPIFRLGSPLVRKLHNKRIGITVEPDKVYLVLFTFKFISIIKVVRPVIVRDTPEIRGIILPISKERTNNSTLLLETNAVFKFKL